MNAFTAPEAREDSRLFIALLLWNQNRDGLSDHFLCGVTEECFSPGIPGCDNSLERLADDGIVRVLDNRTQEGFDSFAMLNLSFQSRGAWRFKRKNPRMVFADSFKMP